MSANVPCCVELALVLWRRERETEKKNWERGEREKLGERKRERARDARVNGKHAIAFSCTEVVSEG